MYRCICVSVSCMLISVEYICDEFIGELINSGRANYRRWLSFRCGGKNVLWVCRYRGEKHFHKATPLISSITEICWSSICHGMFTVGILIIECQYRAKGIAIVWFFMGSGEYGFRLSIYR